MLHPGDNPALQRERLLHDLRHDQFDRWTSGDQIEARDYFTRSPELFLDRDVALDLIYSQFCVAESLGLEPKTGDYVERYPEYSEELTRLFEVHQAIGGVCFDVSTSSRALTASGPCLARSDHGSEATVTRLGRYELLEKVGQGSFADVYRGLDTLLNRDVAVKIPLARRFASEGDAERFLREASSVAQLDHPGIVRVFDLGRDRGIPFIVTEFIHGKLLSKLMETRRIGCHEAAEMVMKISIAIDHAHRQGIVHRDLKPSNIMLTEEHQPRVLDFGLAQSDSRQIGDSVDGAIVGAPAYMSPEQAAGKGHRADARSDVYSLGVILYQLLTGELPFRGTFEAIFHQVRFEDPADARSLDPRIPKDLNTICMRALAKEPARRFATAQEMADDLKRFLQKQPIQSRPVGRIEKLRLACVRNSGMTLLAASVLFTLIVGSVASSFFAIRSSITEAKAQQQTHLLRRTLYNNKIALIQHAIGAGQIPRASKLLETTSPEFRRWEWQYWSSRLHGELRTISVAPNSIVACQPTGFLIAVGGTDGSVSMFDARSGTCIRNISLHRSAITALGFSPDGSLLLSADDDSSVRSWVVEQLLAANVHVPKTNYETALGVVHSFVFRPDGRRFAMGTLNGCWQFRSTRNAAMLFNLDWGSSSHATVFTPSEAEYLFAMGDELIQMTIPGGARQSLLEHDAAITGLSSSADGTWIVSTSHDRTAKVLNRETRSQRTLRGHSDAVLCSAISPLSDMVATAAKDCLVHLWDLRSGTPIRSLRGHSQEVAQLAFMSNGELLASVSEDGCIKLWDAREIDVRPYHTATSVDGIGRLAFSPDDRWIASAASDGVLRLYDADSGTELQILRTEGGACGGLLFTDRGRRLLALFGGQLYAWSVPSRSVHSDIDRWDNESMASSLARPEPCDAPQLSTVEQQAGGQNQVIHCFAHSPSKRFVAYAVDGAVFVNDLASGQRLELQGHAAPICVMAFSPDSTSLAVGSREGGIWIWSLDTKTQWSLPVEHNREITDLCFGPSGDVLLSASADGTARLWSVTAGVSLCSFTGHTGPVNSASFDRTGDRVLTAADDRTLRLWDTKDAVEIMSLECDPRTQARFSHDGSLVAFSPTAGGIVQLDTAMHTSDEKMARWEASRIAAQYPLLSDARLVLDAQEHWSGQGRQAAVNYLTSAASTTSDAPRRILSLLMIDTPDRVEAATTLASALLRHQPDDQLARTLFAACLVAQDCHPQARALLPSAADIVEAPSAMIALLAASPDEDIDDGLQQRLVGQIRQLVSRSADDGIEADFYRYFDSVLDRRLLLGKLNYHKAEFDKARRDFGLASRFRPLSHEQRAMLTTSLAVQRRWVEASQVHAELEYLADDWVYLANDALLRLAARDFEGYRTTCAKLLTLEEHGTDPTKLLLTLIACLAGDNAVDDPQQLLDRVKNLQKLPNAHAGVQILLGLAQFRCGQVEQAQATLRPMLIMAEFASSDLGSVLVGPHSVELKIAHLTCLSTLLQIEQRLGQDLAAEASALKTQQLVKELDELPPVYDGRLGPWNSRVSAELGRQILEQWNQAKL